MLRGGVDPGGGPIPQQPVLSQAPVRSGQWCQALMLTKISWWCSVLIKCLLNQVSIL